MRGLPFVRRKDHEDAAGRASSGVAYFPLTSTTGRINVTTGYVPEVGAGARYSPDGLIVPSGGHALVPSAAAYNFAGTAPFSIEALIRPASIGATQAIVTRENVGGAYNGWVFAILSSGLLYAERTTGGTFDSAQGSTAIKANQWTYVAMTYDGTNIRFYQNGVLDGAPAASAKSMGSTVLDLHIGIYTDKASGPFRGIIRDVLLSGVAQTAAVLTDRARSALSQV